MAFAVEPWPLTAAMLAALNLMGSPTWAEHARGAVEFTLRRSSRASAVVWVWLQSPSFPDPIVDNLLRPAHIPASPNRRH